MHQLEANSIWDVIIIGGGAAGFFSSISIAEHANKPLKIAILEQSGNLLGKVKISGGGRCNVTHNCLDPKKLATHYPRGARSLIGPFHHYGASDTVEWFEGKGVSLKVEPDGRIFPISDSSQTIIDCLTDTAEEHGVQVFTKTKVTNVDKDDSFFTLTLNDEFPIKTRSLLLATGGTRLATGAKLASQLQHHLHPPVPSLFTFSIEDSLLEDLEGISVNKVQLEIQNTAFKNIGPVLITHWGLSGPGVLKLSALAARELADCDYRFTLKLNWIPDLDFTKMAHFKRKEWGKRLVHNRSPFASLPKRLWGRFCQVAKISEDVTWSRLTKEEEGALAQIIHQSQFSVNGKSLNKDEFVTCGGIELKEVNLKTMESKLCENLYFAGEILNIDGVTGGFNFQNAWTTGFLAGRTLAQK